MNNFLDFLGVVILSFIISLVVTLTRGGEEKEDIVIWVIVLTIICTIIMTSMLIIM